MLAAVSAAAATGDVRLIQAVKPADPVAVRALLQKQADVNGADPDGTTALHWAAYQGDAETTALLVRAGATSTPPIPGASRHGNQPPTTATRRSWPSFPGPEPTPTPSTANGKARHGITRREQLEPAAPKGLLCRRSAPGGGRPVAGRTLQGDPT